MADGELSAEGGGGATALLLAEAAVRALVVRGAARRGCLAEDELVVAADLFRRVG